MTREQQLELDRNALVKQCDALRAELAALEAARLKSHREANEWCEKTLAAERDLAALRESARQERGRLIGERDTAERDLAALREDLDGWKAYGKQARALLAACDSTGCLMELHADVRAFLSDPRRDDACALEKQFGKCRGCPECSTHPSARDEARRHEGHSPDAPCVDCAEEFRARDGARGARPCHPRCEFEFTGFHIPACHAMDADKERGE